MVMMWTGLAGAAYADVVTIAEDCPPGATGNGNHGGPYCTPTTCSADTCGTDQKCAPAGLCVFEEERECGGMTTPGSTCTYLHIEATGVCETTDDCDVGECLIEDRCVDKGAVISPENCGCASGPTVPAVLAGVALLSLLATGRRR